MQKTSIREQAADFLTLCCSAAKVAVILGLDSYLKMLQVGFLARFAWWPMVVFISSCSCQTTVNSSVSSPSPLPCAPSAGIWSGSRFFDKSLHLMGFQGEGYTNRSVVVVKTHVDPCPTFKNRHLYAFNKTLHLVRNPFHAIVAERKRLTVRRNFHKANPTWSTFVNGIVGAGDRWRVTSSLPWDAWLDRGMSRWLTTIITVEHAAAQGQPTHTMRFEDLLQDLRGTMADALAFIGNHRQLTVS